MLYPVSQTETIPYCEPGEWRVLLHLDRFGARPASVLHRDDHLRERGTPSARLFHVSSGCLKSYLIDLDGREHVMRFHLPGDVVGLDSMANGRNYASTVALDTTGIHAFRVEDFLSGSCAAEEALLITHAMSREVQILRALSSNHKAEERISAFLASYSCRMAALGCSPTELRLPMSRSDIGNYLRLTPSTISRFLKWFDEDGIIRVRGPSVTILDPARLASLCREITLL